MHDDCPGPAFLLTLRGNAAGLHIYASRIVPAVIELHVHVQPVLVTVPFGDSNQEGKVSEKEAFEERVIDKKTRDAGGDDRSFYRTFYFYPYKNPNPRGIPLTPNQLNQMSKEELDFHT